MRKLITSPKTILGLLLAGSLSVIILAGCASQRYGSAPTKLESQLYDVSTNYVPIVKTVTNTVQVTQYQTNTVPVNVTNEQHQVVVTYTTNVVPVQVSQQQVSQVTNQQPVYSYANGPGLQKAAEVGGAAGSLFGVGGLVSSGILALGTLWGYLRSGKNYATATNLAQTIETAREFVKSLPNGETYDAALTNWMQAHQAQAGVIQNVAGILENEVSNPDAKEAARQVISTIQTLSAPQSPAIAPNPAKV